VLCGHGLNELPTTFVFNILCAVSVKVDYIIKSKTMKTKIFNLIIIDESGSMQSIKQETINSVNETIQTIRTAEKTHADQEHFVSLVLFNSEVKVVNDCVAIADVAKLTDATYQPNCCTALYDAMGLSINALRKYVTPGDKVLVTIVTDGYENASKEWDGKAIKALVEQMRGQGWVFAYIGANHDVESVATSISISNLISFEASPRGVSYMRRRMNSSMDRWFNRISSNESFADSDNCGLFDEF
jgi:uncharacterized protein YegL